MMSRRAWIMVPVLVVCATCAIAGESKKLLLIGQSPDNHAPQTHEYLPGLTHLAELLKDVPDLQVQLVNADEPWTDGPRQLAEADGAVLFLAEGARWTQADPRRYEAFAQLASRGGALVALHWAMGTRSAEPIDGFLKLFGACHGGPDRKYKYLHTDVRIATREHPVTRGIEDFQIRDEFYYQLKRVADTRAVEPLLEAVIDGAPEMVAWAYTRPDGGRSAGFSGLHYHENWQREPYGAFVKRAVLWTLKLPTE